MSFVEVAILSLALAIDAFSIGAVVGVYHCQPRQVFRLAFHFGLFQALMPLIGASAGRLLSGWMMSWGHWVAFGLLVAIGLKMIIESMSRRKNLEDCREVDPTRGLRMLGLSIAVSIDAFGAGVSMGMSMAWAALAWAVLAIGLTASAGTWLGMRLGQTLLGRVGRRVEIFGGLVLIGLGVQMLFP